MKREINYRAVTFAVILIILGVYTFFKQDKLAGTILTGIGLVTSLEFLRWISGLIDLVKSLFKDDNKNGQTMINSKDSDQVKAEGDVYIFKGNVSEKSFEKLIKNKKIKNVKELVLKKASIMEVRDKKIEYKETEEYLKKIYSYLDESKPLSIIAEMSLRLCQNIRTDKYIGWLKNEVYGYEEMNYRGPVEYKKKNPKHPNYRRINVEQWIVTKEGTQNKLDLTFFVTQPLEIIENWVSMATSNQLIMNMPPLKIFIDEFKVDPNEKVPYVVNLNSLKNILVGFRAELNKFLEETKERIEENL